MLHLRRLIALLLLTLISLSSNAQPVTDLEDPPWLKELVLKRIVYSVSGMHRTHVLKDQTYKTVGGEQLKADIYSPVNIRRGKHLPAVIFIHGGRIPATDNRAQLPGQSSQDVGKQRVSYRVYCKLSFSPCFSSGLRAVSSCRTVSTVCQRFT